jgi:hypothetical protein
LFQTNGDLLTGKSPPELGNPGIDRFGSLVQDGELRLGGLGIDQTNGMLLVSPIDSNKGGAVAQGHETISFLQLTCIFPKKHAGLGCSKSL